MAEIVSASFIAGLTVCTILRCWSGERDLYGWVLGVFLVLMGAFVWSFGGQKDDFAGRLTLFFLLTGAFLLLLQFLYEIVRWVRRNR